MNWCVLWLLDVRGLCYSCRGVCYNGSLLYRYESNFYSFLSGVLLKQSNSGHNGNVLGNFSSPLSFVSYSRWCERVEINWMMFLINPINLNIQVLRQNMTAKIEDWKNYLHSLLKSSIYQCYVTYGYDKERNEFPWEPQSHDSSQNVSAYFLCYRSLSNCFYLRMKHHYPWAGHGRLGTHSG